MLTECEQLPGGRTVIDSGHYDSGHGITVSETGNQD